MKFKLNYTIIVVIAAGLLGSSGDITMTWTSPMFEKLKSNDTNVNPLGKPITDTEESLIGSLINIGAMIGPYPFSYIADRFGRRIALFCIGVPHFISYVSFAFANSVYIFYFGRLFGGLAIGAGYAILPMYIAEVAEDSNRGVLSAVLMIFWSFGDLLPYVVGPFMSSIAFNLSMASLPVAFYVMFIWLGVETPYYWLTKNEISKAEETLMYLRSLTKEGIQGELGHIKLNFKREEGGHFSDIIKNPALRKAFFISLSLIALQQLSGNTAISFYLQPIFDATGSSLSSNTSSVIYGFAVIITSLISPFVVNKYNRKTLINVSCSGCGLALTVLGAYFYIHNSTNYNTDSIFWLPIVTIIIYLFFFASGMAVLPWAIASELFPTSCKQISASAVSSSCWISSFIVTQLFTKLVDLMTTAGVFWMFAGWTFFTVVFCIILIPETKDKSFREIQDILGS